MRWEDEARGILKAEFARRGFTYSGLVEPLHKIGVIETPRSIANKMARGRFTFVFFLQCMKAMGADSVRFDVTPYARPARSGSK